MLQQIILPKYNSKMEEQLVNLFHEIICHYILTKLEIKNLQIIKEYNHFVLQKWKINKGFYRRFSGNKMDFLVGISKNSKEKHFARLAKNV